jgi:heterodisulfide reductase subunit B
LNGQFAYYPGCSLHHTSQAYDVSTRRICQELGIKLIEIDDWNCCGATEYFALEALPAYSLVARNLALAASDGMRQVLAPCSLCYHNLYKTDAYMGKHLALGKEVNQALGAGGLHYTPGTLRVRHLLDVLVEDIGHDILKSHVQQPLKGLRLAPYYGCLIARPNSHNPEQPTHLDELLEIMGATVVDFPLKTQCCGGHMTQISEETAYELIRRLLYNAAGFETDLIVTVCPMCQLNLDAYQPQINRHFRTDFHIPVLFFTQVIGLAFGIPPEELGIGEEIVPAWAVLGKIGQEVTEPAQKKPERRDKQALPMPGKDK